MFRRPPAYHSRAPAHQIRRRAPSRWQVQYAIMRLSVLRESLHTAIGTAVCGRWAHPLPNRASDGRAHTTMRPALHMTFCTIAVPTGKREHQCDASSFTPSLHPLRTYCSPLSTLHVFTRCLHTLPEAKAIPLPRPQLRLQRGKTPPQSDLSIASCTFGSRKPP